MQELREVKKKQDEIIPVHQWTNGGAPIVNEGVGIGNASRA